MKYDKDDYDFNVNAGGIVMDLICGLLGVAFVVLKLCGVISWSWVWVLAPFWIPIVLSILLIIIFAVILYFIQR